MCPLLHVGLGPLSTARRTRRQSGGSSPRSGSSTWCITSGVRGVTPGGPPARGLRSGGLRVPPRALPTAYRDLQSREETRNAAWRKRGWDENVYYTGEWDPTRFGDPLTVLGTPWPHLCLLSSPSPADPDHGIPDNDSPEDLPPAVIWGSARGAPCTPRGSLPVPRPCWGSAPPGSQLSPPPPFGVP